ncbi:MAG: tRNA (guanosine(46)-N7)-methyltransferase TrmB [Pirellulales bacterium]
MGRRTATKIDPAIDLSRHLKTWDDLPGTCASGDLFPVTAPLEVEVGSGKGLFLVRAAVQRPSHNFLGIELARRYAALTASRLARRDLPNAMVAAVDARRLFAERLADRSAVAVHVYFPDPWWKKRHHKRRLMEASFLVDVQRVLQPGGTLHFWTDVEAYFHEAVEQIAIHTRLDGPHEEPESIPDDDMDYQTHFERRMRKAGLPVFRARFERH